MPTRDELTTQAAIRNQARDVKRLADAAEEIARTLDSLLAVLDQHLAVVRREA